MGDEREFVVVRGLRFDRWDDRGWIADTTPKTVLCPGDSLVMNEKTPAAVKFTNRDGRIVTDYVGTWLPEAAKTERDAELAAQRERVLERLAVGLDMPSDFFSATATFTPEDVYLVDRLDVLWSRVSLTVSSEPDVP